jgi:hypothetical protein
MAGKTSALWRIGPVKCCSPNNFAPCASATEPSRPLVSTASINGLQLCFALFKFPATTCLHCQSLQQPIQWDNTRQPTTKQTFRPPPRLTRNLKNPLFDLIFGLQEVLFAKNTILRFILKNNKITLDLS